MTKEQMKKYFMEKYGVDIDNMPTEKVEVKDEERTLIYDGIGEGGNAVPFSPQPHNPIRTSGKKPYEQKLTAKDILKGE